jgi:hypothetical protein
VLEMSLAPILVLALNTIGAHTSVHFDIMLVKPCYFQL